MKTTFVVLCIGAMLVVAANAAYIDRWSCTDDDGKSYSDGEVVPVSQHECWVCRCQGGDMTTCSNELCPELGVGK